LAADSRETREVIGLGRDVVLVHLCAQRLECDPELSSVDETADVLLILSWQFSRDVPKDRP
jgi:hypothetical protein